MKFTIQAKNLNNEIKVFTYDNMSNTLSDIEGNVFENFQSNTYSPAKSFSKDNPLRKSKEITTIKIQLGLSCNYSCEYCSQRFVERPKETTKKDIAEFMSKLENLSFSEEKGLKIEFWGGEPFVYWKTLKPLTEAIELKFADWKVKPVKSVITNGSILNEEICDWLFENNFYMAISHDGPGQHLRGPDPFEDEKQKQFILNFYRRMRRAGRGFSFNSMLNVHNMSRKKIYDWFVDFTGDFSVQLGEGGMIDAYDFEGIKNSLQTKADHFKFRQIAFDDIYSNNGAIGFRMIVDKVDEFTQSVLSHKPANSVPQKCGMDMENTLAVDLHGNVITCHNTSIEEVSGNGEKHHSGNIENIESVEIKTATHWSNREHCPKCPVVHICKGACMYLEGANWEVSCDNSYSDAIAIFALSFEKMTGFIPVLIENNHISDMRRDIFGTVLQHTEENKKAFPIKVVAEKSKIKLNDVEVYTKAQ